MNSDTTLTYGSLLRPRRSPCRCVLHASRGGLIPLRLERTQRDSNPSSPRLLSRCFNPVKRYVQVDRLCPRSWASFNIWLVPNWLNLGSHDLEGRAFLARIDTTPLSVQITFANNHCFLTHESSLNGCCCAALRLAHWNSLSCLTNSLTVHIHAPA